MNSPEFKKAVEVTFYEDYEDWKRLYFIYSELGPILHKGGRVLDVGCGMGNISKALGALGFSVLGIDVDEPTIEMAKHSNPFPDTVAFECANAEELNDRADKFDAIVCSEVLEHLEDPAALVHQFTPWLKQDGLLIVTVPNGMGPREVLVTKPVQFILKTPLKYAIVGLKKMLGYKNATLQSNNPDLSHIQFFRFKTIRYMMENAGYSLIRRGKSNFIEKVFPFSLYFKHNPKRQKKDADFAERLPHWMNSGFYTSWKKN